LAENPEIISQGFVWVPEAGDLIEQARQAIAKTVNGNQEDDPEALERRIKRRLEDLFFTETRRRPVVIPVVTES